ncbi:MAG: hypothetical protein HY826_11525 [Actinobacteria bacterium]|nr:hypothetical protein [Actinomycetota bacterium]
MSDQPIPGQVSNDRSGPSFALILLAIVAALATVFFLQNGEEVAIDFLVFEKLTTIRWSILMAVALGILLDRAFSFWWRRRRSNKKNS